MALSPVEDGGHEERVEAEEDECKAEEKEANSKQPAVHEQKLSKSGSKGKESKES